MIYTAAIGFMAVVIIVLILIHRANKRIINHYQSEIQQHLNRLKNL